MTKERLTQDEYDGAWTFCCCICECENSVSIDPLSDTYPMCGTCMAGMNASHAPAGSEEERDFRLIAAAPRMAELLDRLAGWLENYATESPPEFEADVDAARDLLSELNPPWRTP